MISNKLEQPGEANGSLFMVGVGASGGHEALTTLMARLAPASAAFVVVMRGGSADPRHLLEALSKATRMPVMEARASMQMQVDHVYVLPRDAVMTCARGRFTTERSGSAASRMPIDAVFRSLAVSGRSRAVGVILSGDGPDGALGVQAIRAHGGVTFAQEASSARDHAKPLAALATGCVDFMLPPQGIAAELRRTIALHREARGGAMVAEELQQIFGLLREAHAVDFSRCRAGMVKRRVQRRMVLNKVPSVGEYVELCRGRPLEVSALHEDLLTQATHFFREPETFEALARQVLPKLMGTRPLRIWVPGCATGEEAYSIAMTIREVSAAKGVEVPFQIFATDVSEEALSKARRGTYIENIALDVSPERLRRFFVRAGAHYQVDRALRDACMFARHDVTCDPPFSRIDLISCRGVLSGFNAALRREVTRLLSFALSPSGYLVLGGSEEPDGSFSRAADAAPIYDKLAGARPRAAVRGSSEERPTLLDLRTAADRVLSRHAPPGIVVNNKLEILDRRGNVERFLGPLLGGADLGTLMDAGSEPARQVRVAVQQAIRSEARVCVEDLQMGLAGSRRAVGVTVVPLVMGERDADDRCVLVLFEEPAMDRDVEGHVKQLTHELAESKEYLRLTLAEQEAAGDMFVSTSEALLAGNDELLCAREALEAQGAQLRRACDELAGLLVGAQVCLVMLDRARRVVRSSGAAFLSLGPGDVGRPVAEVVSALEEPELEQLVAQAIDLGVAGEREARGPGGRRFTVQVRPHRTTEDAIDGAVVLLVEHVL